KHRECVELRIAEIIFVPITGSRYAGKLSQNLFIILMFTSKRLILCPPVNGLLLTQQAYFTGFYEDEQVKYCCNALICRKL
ncbi:MAG: hypothetical protein WC628_08735, partial [Candidatus Omnitrophota bacterium]